MDNSQGNLKSGDAQAHLRHSPALRSQSYEDDISPTHLGLGISNSALNDQFTSQQFLPSPNQNIFDASLAQQPQQQQQQFSQANLGEAIYAPSDNQNFQPGFQQQFDTTQNFGTQQCGFQDNFLDSNNLSSSNISSNDLGQSNFGQEDFSLFTNNTNINQSFQPNMFMGGNQQQLSNPSINPVDLGLGGMPSPHHHSPTPPQGFQQEFPQVSSTRPSPSFNAQHSPSFDQNQFSHTPGHSRQASLQPETAQFLNAQPPINWQETVPQQYRNHRRTPSEFSDFSASSAAPSPNLGLNHSFDNVDQRNSPMMHPQDQNAYQDLLGMQQFSISDNSVHQGTSPFHGRSPAHSPIPSPRLNPQQGAIGDINQQSPFNLSMNNTGQNFTHNSVPAIYGDNADQFHSERNNSTEMGQAQQMAPPDINIEFAPASRQNSFEPPKPVPIDQDALLPPQRGTFTLQSETGTH